MHRDGLEGVVVAETEIADIDGAAGRLVVRGYPIEALAGRVGFEGMVGLLRDGALPDDAARAALRTELGAARMAAFERLRALGDALEATDGMDALRTALSHAAVAQEREAPVALAGAAAVLVAA